MATNKDSFGPLSHTVTLRSYSQILKSWPVKKIMIFSKHKIVDMKYFECIKWSKVTLLL